MTIAKEEVRLLLHKWGNVRTWVVFH
jgi:hypothetical protein